MKIKHVKTLPLNTDTRLFFTIENDSEVPIYGNLLLELRNWWGVAMANFDMSIKVIYAHSFVSFYVDVPKKVAKRFNSFKWIGHRQNKSEGLWVYDGKGKKDNDRTIGLLY